jgi:hypothetical protein
VVQCEAVLILRRWPCHVRISPPDFSTAFVFQHSRFCARHGPYSLVDGSKEGVWNQYTGDGILQRVRRVLFLHQSR